MPYLITRFLSLFSVQPVGDKIRALDRSIYVDHVTPVSRCSHYFYLPHIIHGGLIGINATYRESKTCLRSITEQTSEHLQAGWDRPGMMNTCRLQLKAGQPRARLVPLRRMHGVMFYRLKFRSQTKCWKERVPSFEKRD